MSCYKKKKRHTQNADVPKMTTLTLVLSCPFSLCRVTLYLPASLFSARLQINTAWSSSVSILKRSVGWTVRPPWRWEEMSFTLKRPKHLSSEEKIMNIVVEAYLCPNTTFHLFCVCIMWPQLNFIVFPPHLLDGGGGGGGGVQRVCTSVVTHWFSEGLWLFLLL